MIGYVAASLEKKKDLYGQAELTGLFVLEKYRGDGIGLKLMYIALKTIKKRGVNNVFLLSWRQLKSNKLYISLGGRIISEQVRNYEGKDLMLDVFLWEIDELLSRLEKRPDKYSTEYAIINL